MKSLLLVLAIAAPLLAQITNYPTSQILSGQVQVLDASGKVLPAVIPAIASKKLWPSMLSWKAALVNCSGSVAVLGDSVGHGVGASPFTAGWTWQLNNLFAPKCGATAGGLYTVGNGDGYTFVGTWTPYTSAGPNQSTGTAISAARSAGSSATASVTMPSGTIYDVWYYTDADTVSGFTVQVDGGGGTIYGNATSGTPSIAKATIGGLSYFPHVIKITAPASGNIHLLGISSEVNASAGIQVYNVSTPSANTEYYNSAAKLSWLTQVPNLSLIIYSLGTNDVSTNTSVVTQANLNATLSYIQATFPSIAVLFVTEPPRQTACTSSPSNECQPDIDAILRSTAAVNNYPFLSVSERWKNWATANSVGFMFDAVHPSTSGHSDINAMVGDFLAESYIAGVGANGTLAINQGVTGSGINLVAPSGVQPVISSGDQASGTNVYLKYNKAANQGFMGVTGGSDSLFLQTNGANRFKIDQFGQISTVKPTSGLAFGVNGQQAWSGNTVTQSGATAAFDFYNGNKQIINLAASITSSTATHVQPNALYWFEVCQPVGQAYTFAWPANVFGGSTTAISASTCLRQLFSSDTAGTNLYAMTAGVAF